MAIVSMTDHTITVNSSALTTFCSSVNIPIDAAENDVSVFGTAWAQFVAGLKKGTLTLVLFNDYASSQLDSILWPLFGTVVTWAVRSTSGSKTTSNPEYSGNVLISHLTPIMAKVGDVPVQSISWPTSGTVARATS